MTKNDVIRIEYPTDDFDAWVEVPKIWRGYHTRRRDEVMRKVNELGNIELGNTCLALSLAEDWGGIDGFESKNPEEWKPEEVPIPVIAWLVDVVIDSFNKAYTVPKNS